MNSAKMNPEAKVKIVEALRSGKYQQGMGKLRRNDGSYCFWGVVCDVSGLDEWHTKHGDDNCYLDGFFIPPFKVQEWTGITEYTKVNIDGQRESLLAHSDNGVPFDKLAEAIEQQL